MERERDAIEITPEMIDAGVRLIEEADWRGMFPAALARAVYTAMRKALSDEESS